MAKKKLKPQMVRDAEETLTLMLAEIGNGNDTIQITRLPNGHWQVAASASGQQGWVTETRETLDDARIALLHKLEGTTEPPF